MQELRLRKIRGSYKPDSTADRSPKIEVIGTPRRGYLTLSDYEQDMLAYAFRGIDKITNTPKEDGTDGGGLAYENNNPREDTVPTGTANTNESTTTQGGNA